MMLLYCGLLCCATVTVLLYYRAAAVYWGAMLIDGRGVFEAIMPTFRCVPPSRVPYVPYIPSLFFRTPIIVL